MKFILFFMFVFFNFVAYSQDNNYKNKVKEAFALYSNGKYLESAIQYSDAFKHQPAFESTNYFKQQLIIDDRYNAACSWALCGNSDSAFNQLFLLANNFNYINLNHLVQDKDLFFLHKDKRWLKVISKVKANRLNTDSKLDKKLMAILDSIHIADQYYRKKIKECQISYGFDSPQMDSIWTSIKKTDSTNLLVICNILDNVGWPTYEIVGDKSVVPFLILQHSPLQFQEKYLPLLKNAVMSHKADPSHLAYLQDRINIKKKIKQVYGTQLGINSATGKYYLEPIENPQKVDELRNEIGLPNLQDYLDEMGIKIEQ